MVAPEARAAVAALLATKGLVRAQLEGERLVLSELGKFVIERCGTFREAVSYRPMLRQLETVLSGDVREVFTHDADGHEMHVDRTMNVLASGFMHQVSVVPPRKRLRHCACLRVAGKASSASIC